MATSEIRSVLSEYFSPTAYTSSGLTAGTGCSIDFGGYVKIGKIVVVNIRVVVSSTLSVGHVVVSGFPKCIGNKNHISFSTSVSSDSSFYMDTDGKLLVSLQTTPRNYLISGVYICV